MSDFLKAKIITVKSLILETSALSVNLPAEDGEIGILPGHVPMLIKLKSGAVKIVTSDNVNFKYFIYGGIAEITGGFINILTNFASDLLTATKTDILNEISKLENLIKGEIHDHNIAAIKLNLHKQTELLNYL